MQEWSHKKESPSTRWMSYSKHLAAFQSYAHFLPSAYSHPRPLSLINQQLLQRLLLATVSNITMFNPQTFVSLLAAASVAVNVAAQTRVEDNDIPQQCRSVCQALIAQSTVCIILDGAVLYTDLA